MARQSNRTKVKLTFYPMIGSMTDVFSNTLRILSFVEKESPNPQRVRDWIHHTFGASHRFAENIYTVIFSSGQLVEIKGGVCFLTNAGREILRSANPENLLRQFVKNFAGIEDLLEILRQRNTLGRADFVELWREAMANSFPQLSHWKSSTVSDQFNHRISWLRALGFVDFVGGSFLLSEEGLRFLTALRAQTAKTASERLEVSHQDLEEKMKVVGEFFQFDARKRASVNFLLPKDAHKLKEDRQLDCLWVRYVHFGGRVQYPIEIQISGSIADTIERLETVSQFVQKALIVTDKAQQEKIYNRLRTKHSPLVDKLVFIDVDNVDKIVEAANIMKSFTDRVFT